MMSEISTWAGLAMSALSAIGTVLWRASQTISRIETMLLVANGGIKDLEAESRRSAERVHHIEARLLSIDAGLTLVEDRLSNIVVVDEEEERSAN
jgi:hypothetical protein